MLKLKKQDKKVLNEIKQTIRKVAKELKIEIDKIILFGSRARGDYREDSDWDILVVTKNKLRKDKYDLFYSKLAWGLAEIEGIFDFDLLIIDVKRFNYLKKYKGYVYFWVNKEGVIL